MQRYVLIIGLLTGFFFSAMAQKPVTSTVKKSSADSVQEKKDSLKSKPFVPKSAIKVYHPDSTHSPSKAWHRSVFVPGWGQVYNHRIWKVPIIYTGLTLLVVMYKYNAKNYKQDLAIARYMARGISPQPTDPYYTEYQFYQRLSPETVNDAVRGYARYRDLSVLLFAASWGIQTIDAYVDAKFIHSYTMDNNFSVKVAPTLITSPVYAQSLNDSFIPGLKITFTLR
jgi:hypothetical protein